MPPPSDELLQRIAQSAATWPHARLEQLLREARAEAEAEVKDLLKSAIRTSLLREAAQQLDRSPAQNTPGQSASAAPDRPRDRDTPSQELSARYVYCITPAGRAQLPDNLNGVAATDQFDSIHHGSVQAITSPVAERDFDQQTMEQRLANPQWLDTEVRSHEAVIRAAMAAGPVIPLRFATVLRTRDDVLRVLETHQEAIRQTLDALHGKKEWGVKIVQLANGDAGAQFAATADAQSG